MPTVATLVFITKRSRRARGDEARERAKRAADEVQERPLVGVGAVGVLLDLELRVGPQRDPRLVHHRELGHAVLAGDDRVARVDLRCLA